jgi:REP element-mobilizing transposase RayT
MPRKPRIEFPGAFYHVIARGNKKEEIFLEPGGKKRFLDKLIEYRDRYKFIVYAYVLMDNHIHLLIETDQVPLSKIMQGVLQSHSQWHNKKYETVGHLFQGRYKAILCDKDAYLIVLVCYIHANPVRAGLVENAADYAWSSHRAYLGHEKSELVEIEFFLHGLSHNKSQAVKLYNDLLRDYLNRGSMDELYELRDQRILGSEEFFNDVMKKAGEKAGNFDGILRDKKLADIALAVGELTGVTPAELKGRQRSPLIMRARAMFIQLAQIFSYAKRKEMASFLDRNPTALHYIEQKISEEDLWANIRKLKW